MRSCLGINATLVANEFIDRYMAGANGEYVKVYLYLLRHEDEELNIGAIADALNHTEADVRRALGYWERAGVLTGETETAAETAGAPKQVISGGEVSESALMPPGREQARAAREAAVSNSGMRADGRESRQLYTPEQVGRLADREEFTQLLYISQKYMNKVFTPRECEVFAYLYDALHMPVELLEYLVEYCVQNGHYSIRYLESVALNWYEKGIRNVSMAKEYTASFSKEGFAVMRAFGISDRRPGEAEQKLIDKWFKEFGFTKDIIVEACGRTLAAIHKPSFSYADKILTDWKKGGVRVLADVGKMDEKREREGKKGGRNTGPVKPARNQFHNFEQRGTDYDAMVLERLKERLGEQKEQK